MASKSLMMPDDVAADFFHVPNQVRLTVEAPFLSKQMALQPSTAVVV